MKQLENRAGVLGGFGMAVCEVEKTDDRFPVAKSRPPLSVVIKIGPGKWAPLFLSSASGTRFLGLLRVSSGDRLLEVEQLAAARGPARQNPGPDQPGREECPTGS